MRSKKQTVSQIKLKPPHPLREEQRAQPAGKGSGKKKGPNPELNLQKISSKCQNRSQTMNFAQFSWKNLRKSETFQRQNGNKRVKPQFNVLCTHKRHKPLILSQTNPSKTDEANKKDEVSKARAERKKMD